MADSDFQDLKLEVGLLKKDVVQIGVLCEKLDTTIEKVQELTSAMTKMLALHEERIEKQETREADLIKMVEQRRLEHDANFKEIHSRITTTDREIAKDMSDLEDRIEKAMKAQMDVVVKEVQKLQDAQAKHHEKMSERLNLVERKIWTFAGGAMVVVYLFSQFSDTIGKIFGG